ncbi:hypothetical protein A4A49_52621 [Nicotiana attenuata]|uniref:F-box domain-containing protein n=1 Tax=Nicotiana attenuata TaxID=49451 RepID=A0A1J6KUK9_NICAT|nr:hypothetical protein A4A49_52621 [Nicotiana attenuata]
MLYQTNQSKAKDLMNNMELHDDLVVEIISYLPLKKLIQCKTLNKKFNHLLSDPNFVETHALPPVLTLLYSESISPKIYNKISPYPISTCSNNIETRQSYVEVPKVVASCNGLLLLLYWSILDTLCVFNPITGMKQCLGSDYPNSDQYTVVMVQVIGKQKGYELNMFSSEDTAGVLWQGYQLTTDSASFEYFFSKPAYLHHTLYWLMADGCVLAFDTKKKSARILNNSLHVIKHLPNGDNRIRIGYYTWFGVAKGKLHLVCTLKKYIVVVAYDDKIQNWEVVYTVANFRTGLNMNGRPLCLDNKRLLFLVYRRSEDGALYEYDFKTETYRILVLVPTKFLERQAFVPFVPTLAKVRNNDSLHAIYPTEISQLITFALDMLKQLFSLDN